MGKYLRYLIGFTYLFTVTAVLLPECFGDGLFDDEFVVKRGMLLRDGRFFTIRSIQTPDLLRRVLEEPELSQIVPLVNRVAAVGGNTVCFDLCGFTDDYSELSRESVRAIATLMKQVTWRRMGAICRVVTPEKPAEAAARVAVAKGAADALKFERRMVYWFDGPDGTDLAEVFEKRAGFLVTAAETGADVAIVDAEPEDDLDKPVVCVGTIPDEPQERTGFVLPAGEGSYVKLDTAMMTQQEKEPWKPDNSVLTQEEREQGWIALFDGESLDGWRVAGFNKNGFQVEDGVLKWVRPGASALLSHDRYSDFILRIEWKINERGNSGIFLRAPRGGRASKIGMEFQLKGDHGKPPHKNSSGAVYDVVAPLENASKPEGEWNEVEITLDGPKLKAVMNGVVIHDLNMNENEELKYRIREGFIGLQDHGHPVRFRNIRIKPL